MAKEAAMTTEQPQKFTAYVTKYALTEGVQEVAATFLPDSTTSMIYYSENGHTCYAHGKDWYRSYPAAVSRAAVMRDKKIASLKKQIAKLETLKFA